jgi:SAM-dependent methyltransferase
MSLDERLLRYYLELRSPEAGEWNLSPECLHAELITRDYVRKSFALTTGFQACNVGIGTGDWDDYLGYWLKGTGQLTSIDVDPLICEIFAYRQRREGHPNPANTLNKSIFDSDLPQGKFDLVTLIGSAVNEAGDFERCLDGCMRLLKPGGHLMYMANLKHSPVEKLEAYCGKSKHPIEQLVRYETYAGYPFAIAKVTHTN